MFQRSDCKIPYLHLSVTFEVSFPWLPWVFFANASVTSFPVFFFNGRAHAYLEKASVWNTTTGCGVDRIANTFCHNLFLIESKTIGSHSTFAHHLVNSVRGEPGVTLSLSFIVITVVIIEVTKYWATGGRATQEYIVTIFFFRFEYVHHGLVDRTWITDFHTIQ